MWYPTQETDENYSECMRACAWLLLLSTRERETTLRQLEPPTAHPLTVHARYIHLHYMRLSFLSTMKDAEHQGVIDPPQTTSPASKHIL